MTTNIRAGVLALAGMTAALAGSLASADRIAHADRGQASDFAPLVPVRKSDLGAMREAARGPVAGPLHSRMTRLARNASEAEASRPHFPVQGEFNWGQSGARFGAGRSGHSHEGQDVFARTGTPLVAIRDGVVLETGTDGGRGNYVAIYSHRARRTYVYLHMSAPARVRSGQRVRGGQRLGAVGCTGSCFGDHLHFEVRRGRALNGPPTDPYQLLRRWAGADGARATLPPGQS